MSMNGYVHTYPTDNYNMTTIIVHFAVFRV